MYSAEQKQMELLMGLSQNIKTVPLSAVVALWPRIANISFLARSQPLLARSHPLVLSAGAGRADLVEFLLPLSGDEEIHAAFEISAQRKHLNTLKLFIGHVDPNGNNGQALQWAISNKDYPMIDFLLDIVNPKDALTYMKAGWSGTDAWMYVSDHAAAKSSAKRIQKAINTVSPLSSVRKM